MVGGRDIHGLEVLGMICVRGDVVYVGRSPTRGLGGVQPRAHYKQDPVS